MTTRTLMKMRSSSIFVASLLVAACGNGVSSSADAEKAYLGLDPSVDKAIATRSSPRPSTAIWRRTTCAPR
jgi:hypothetical protein